MGGHTRSRQQLSFRFGVDDLHFTASFWYGDVDFHELEGKYGVAFMERIYFHIAAFTANTLVSLSPDTFDPGPYARLCNNSFRSLWYATVRGVWAQWRYEHNRPDYRGPLFKPLSKRDAAHDFPPVNVQPGEAEVLSFCGGGKDSLVSLKLLERAGASFHTLVYSSSIYGSASRQHSLCDGLLDAANVPAMNRRRIWCYDDLTDSPVLRLHPEYGARSMTSGETPASIFLALPLVLQHGYTQLCLGHERSADTGNLTWKGPEQQVNHQWGKSCEAEKLLNEYVRTHLVANCHYFSILKPIYDVLIFNLLNGHEPNAVFQTHSCNVRKPWCGKCSKCAYVWVNYMAYLPPSIVKNVFPDHGNLLDAPENQHSFRQMLGLELHTPFECIGEIDEARLAFELCRRKGVTGTAMGTFVREVPPVDVPSLLDRYLHVNEANNLPVMLRDGVLNQMRAAAERTRHALMELPSVV